MQESIELNIFPKVGAYILRDLLIIIYFTDHLDCKCQKHGVEIVYNVLLWPAAWQVLAVHWKWFTYQLYYQTLFEIMREISCLMEIEF